MARQSDNNSTGESDSQSGRGPPFSQRTDPRTSHLPGLLLFGTGPDDALHGPGRRRTDPQGVPDYLSLITPGQHPNQGPVTYGASSSSAGPPPPDRRSNTSSGQSTGPYGSTAVMHRNGIQESAARTMSPASQMHVSSAPDTPHARRGPAAQENIEMTNSVPETGDGGVTGHIGHRERRNRTSRHAAPEGNESVCACCVVL